MHPSQSTILVFSKIPSLCPAKTRLDFDGIDPLTRIRLAQAFLYDVLECCSTVSARLILASDPGIDLTQLLQELRATGLEPPAQIESQLALISQEDLEFGPRLQSTIEKVSASSVSTSAGICVLGADSPTLAPNTIREALSAISRGSFSLGPTPAGGLYLIGIPQQALSDGFDLSGIFSGADTEYQSLCREILKFGTEIHTLPLHFDVDLESDLVTLISLLEGLTERSNSANFRYPRATAALLAEVKLEVQVSESNNREHRIRRRRF